MRLRSAALALATVFVLTYCDAILQAGVKAQELSERAQVRAQWSHENVELAKLFDAVVEAVNKNFFDEAVLKQHNWLERAQATRPLVLVSPTIDDAIRQINKLLAELGTSHTALYTPNDYQYYILLDIVGSGLDLTRRRFWGNGPYYPGIGIFTREVGGRNFVDDVLEGSPADSSGLKFGDEILFVDGRPYSPIESFHGKIGATVELMVRRAANAEPERLTVTVVPIRPAQAFSDATEASARVIERDGNRVGYVHVWALAESISFKNALGKFELATVIAERLARKGIFITPDDRDAMRAMVGEVPKPIDSLIVDLRGRVGGYSAVAGEMLETLDGGSYWGSSHAFGRFSGKQLAGVQRASFRGRSALLIDAQTRSAAEIMAYGYKRSAFGPLLGTTTAGAVSSGRLYPMPGDTLLYLAVAGLDFDGYRLEGTGVIPDHWVERPLPYAQGADPVLDAAAKLLSSPDAK
jgi:carboxyl-terminal processing protease